MTIWYDFTTTQRNQGRNGIANVEWRIGMALIERCGDGVRAFAHDERNGLYELDPQVDLADAVYAEARPAPTVLVGRNRGGLRGTIRALLAAALGPNAPSAEGAIASMLGTLRRTRERWLRAIRRRLPSARSAPRLVDLVSSDDVVISLGADWSGALVRQLEDLKDAVGCRLVTMVYDLIPLTHTHLAFHADQALFTAYYRTILSASDLVTCISTQTRCDLFDFISRYEIAAPPTEVLRLGDGIRVPEGQAAARDDFFLVVGTVERRKNVELLYDALRILESRGSAPPTIVVAGATGWGVEDFLHELSVATTGASRSLVMIGTVDDRALDTLYRRARALLFPSHYEGWGLPLREAAVYGCPIAAGDSPAAREAIRSYAGAVLLSPDDAAPWADYMTSDPASGEPADFRPWSACADDLLAIIKSELGSGQRPSR
jgi:glycosyltransferase involved in cell wall biosynthesis